MKKTILITLSIAAVLSILSAAVVIFNSLVYIDTYRDEIIVASQKALKRRVTYKNGDFSFRNGPAFTFFEVTVMERDGKTPFVSSEQLSFKVALLPLLEKRVVLKEVRLVRPNIRLIRDDVGKFNFSDIMEGERNSLPLLVRNIRIKNGTVTLSDQFVSAQGVTTSVQNLDLSVSRTIGGTGSDIRLSAALSDNGVTSPVSLNGTVKLSQNGNPLFDTRLDLKISARNINADHYWDYYSRYVPFRKISGRLDIDSSYKGKLSDFSSSGTIKIAGLHFDYPQVFHTPLTPKELQLNYNMELTPRDLSVKHLTLDVDGLVVKGNCDLRDIYSNDLLIDARAITNSFRIEEYGRYIPYGIIPDDTSEFIAAHIKGGTCRLQEGTLQGPVSRIANMGKGTNYNVLSIKGTVEKGIVSFGNTIPVFNGVRGNLALHGKDFILSGMEGFFGTSPFKLDGRITDYPLDKPSAYPFTMTMTPEPAEVAWLLNNKKRGNFDVSGKSLLFLSGNGYTSNYAMSGAWDLTGAAYRYSDLVNKPAGQANHLSFKGSINGEQAKVTGLHYTLNSLSLSAGGSYHFTGEKQAAFWASSNQFRIQDVSPLVPKIEKYLPKGKVKASIQGKSITGPGDNFSVSGSVFMSGASFKPLEEMKQLENIHGNVHFTNNSLQSSMLSAKIGNSAFICNGNLTGLKNPSFDLDFSLPVLDFSDIGLHGGHDTPAARKVRGSIVFRDGNLRIRNLSGQINNSAFNLSGTVEDIRNPKIDIAMTSPYLELGDILLLKGVESAKKRAGAPAKVSGKLTVHADAGKIDRFSFSKLDTVLQFGEQTTSIQPIEFSLLGGTVSAKGTADYSGSGKTRYMANLSIKNISADQLMHALGSEREVTGNISLHGKISAVGDSTGEMRKTASGNIELVCTDGSLRKFAVLSKIFSILNVSQLLKFQLPDMVSGGMPYNKITGTFALQNGVVNTDNFFIDSDAMNISMIGMFDLAREKLDLTVGVKPLQTVDKIVSRIPIVGWVLTGKNRSLVTAYFEAKGSWDNPQVRAIPVKSLAKGVFNIFKRVFQLPAKLITDTGEVIAIK